MLFLTIPTAGTRPDTLERLIQESGLPPSQVVLVATATGIDLPSDCVVVVDTGPINIQRWWTVGIVEAVKRGATAVAVSNDDVVINSETLPKLHAALEHSGATIASPRRQHIALGLHRGRVVPYSPILWGSLWVLDPTKGLMPDTRYRWWYGDNDLDIRARRFHTGIVSVDAYFEHKNAGEATGTSAQLRQLAQQDLTLYESEYSRLIWVTHKWSTLRNLVRRSKANTSSDHSDEAGSRS